MPHGGATCTDASPAIPAGHGSLHVMASPDQRPNAAVRAEPRVSAPPARATRWHARSSSSARSWARSSWSRKARSCWSSSSASAGRPSRCGAPDSADDRRALAAEMDAIDLPRAEVLIRAFGLYFQLANLAEEKQRVRRLRPRARQAHHGLLDGSVAEAVETLRRGGCAAEPGARVAGAAVGRPGAHGASHRGPPPDAAHRASPLLSPARRSWMTRA